MRPDELTDDAIDYIIDNMDEKRLSKWERGFFESVSEQWERKRFLTDGQKETLGQVWEGQP